MHMTLDECDQEETREASKQALQQTTRRVSQRCSRHVLQTRLLLKIMHCVFNVVFLNQDPFACDDLAPRSQLPPRILRSGVPSSQPLHEKRLLKSRTFWKHSMDTRHYHNYRLSIWVLLRAQERCCREGQGRQNVFPFHRYNTGVKSNVHFTMSGFRFYFRPPNAES